MYSKPCAKCGKTKTKNEFYKNKGAKDGLHSRCITCYNRNRKREALGKEPSRVSYGRCPMCNTNGMLASSHVFNVAVCPTDLLSLAAKRYEWS